MFLIKLVNSVLIIIVCAYIGINKANVYIFRVNKLRKIRNAFNIFKSKLEFTYEPIKDIFKEISKIVYKDNNNIFKSYIDNIENDNYEDAWSLAVAENSIYLSKDDISIITSFGNLLGKTDLSGQISEIKLTDEFLDKQILSAEEEKKKNEKMYKSLGIIIGIAIVIILF